MRSTVISWTIYALVLNLGSVNANPCYYPDGRTISTTDIPCNGSAPASSCCNQDAFCLVGGLCFGGGIVSRGSCTDPSWQDGSCAKVCKTDEPAGDIPITPCTSGDGGADVNSFVCGVNTTGCNSGTGMFDIPTDLSIILRPAQVASLLQSQLANQPNQSGMFTAGAVVGVAVGVAAPLIIALIVVVVMLTREKRKNDTSTAQQQEELISQEAKPKFDSPESSPNLPIPSSSSPLMSAPSVASSIGMRSRASSLRSPLSEVSRFPSGTFADRYSAMRQNARNEDSRRHEMESHEPSVVQRYELSEKRMS